MIGAIIVFSACLILTAIVILTIRYLENKQKKEQNTEINKVNEKIANYDKSLKEAFAMLDSMGSIEEVEKLKEKIKNTEAELSSDKDNIGELEKELAEKQALLNDNLEKITEEQDASLMEEVESPEAQFTSTNEVLENLSKSREALESLPEKIELNEDQKGKIKSIETIAKQVFESLESTRESYKQNTDRFIGLQTQHRELEKEYDRLKEAE